MKMQVIVALCLLHLCLARESTYYETAAEKLQDGLDKAGDFFSHKFKDAKDFAATTPEELRQRLKDVQGLLDVIKKKKDELYKSGNKQSQAALDKLNEWYDMTAKYAKEAKDVSADKYDDLSKRWAKQSAEMYKNGFDDFVRIAQAAKKTAKETMDQAEPYYQQAYESLKDALATGGNYFGTKFQEAKDFSAKTPEELQKRVKDVQELLEAARGKKDELYKSASKQSKVALDKLNDWYDITSKYAKESKDVAADKFEDLNKRWGKSASEMYTQGFNDLVKIAQVAKKSGRQALDQAEDAGQAFYVRAAEVLKDGLATLSDFFSARFYDIKDFVVHSPEDLRKILKDTQDLIETINSRKGEIYDTASENAKLALDKLSDWYDTTKEFAAEAKDVSTEKFTDLNSRWTVKSQEMYETGFDEIIKIAQQAKKTLKKKIDEL